MHSPSSNLTCSYPPPSSPSDEEEVVGIEKVPELVCCQAHNSVEGGMGRDPSPRQRFTTNSPLNTFTIPLFLLLIFSFFLLFFLSPLGEAGFVDEEGAFLKDFMFLKFSQSKGELATAEGFGEQRGRVEGEEEDRILVLYSSDAKNFSMTGLSCTPKSKQWKYSSYSFSLESGTNLKKRKTRK